MKKILFTLLALIGTLSMNAQIMKVMKGSTVVKTYTVDQADKAVFTTASSKFLPGKFSVGAAKQVKFTKSNLYWDGSAFKFEAKQTDYPTTWDANHVSHFYWTKNAADSYAESYTVTGATTTDVPFFAQSLGGLTVEGASGLYALTNDEWNYLINTRTNAATLKKWNVSVGGVANCLIIAPDDFTGTLQATYTLDEVNTLGLVCLPTAGRRVGSTIDSYGTNGRCWSATPSASEASKAWYLNFDNKAETTNYTRNRGQSLRLVATAQ